MKFSDRKPFRNALAALSLSLVLSACGQMPWLGGGAQQQQFQPLQLDTSLIGAPQEPQAAGSLVCRVGGGEARFGKHWAPYETVEYRLAPNGRQNGTLSRRHGGDEAALQGIFDADGQKLIFCPVVEGAPEDRISCTSIYALDDDLNMGIKRTFDVPDAIRGGSITCAYDEKKLKKI